ncbi:hypothetical protein [Eubacterium ruminantium]|uniref:hypothetical protein n=1 Tax=Eubacterium ruminantium TaxID=42322 RepID=UPI0015A47F6B|nr:hypothetical protein [Eubacterium ruminantium]
MFEAKEAVQIERKYGNVNIIEKRCPFCEGEFRQLDLPTSLDRYLYVNTDSRYYGC